ncbi:MAG: hypothetical protein N3A58_06025 [Spirochaetes bacterium]|nr:hypothetical protein [Spirochaetota bacterium]
MDLKQIFQKIENFIYPKIESNNLNYKFNKEELDYIFSILYPYIIFYSKNFRNDDDFANDFALYFYEKIDYIINNYDIKKSSISTYLILVIKSKLYEFLKSTKKKIEEISLNEIYSNCKSINSKNCINEIEENTPIYIDSNSSYYLNDDQAFYKKIINNIIDSLNGIDKAIFCLYYYEILDEKLIVEVSNILNIEISVLINLINEFRNTNNKKYETFEILKHKIYKIDSSEKKEKIFEKISTYNITGDISIIAKLTNLSENALRIRLTRIKEKFLKK